MNNHYIAQGVLQFLLFLSSYEKKFSNRWIIVFMLVPFFHACKPIYSTVSFQEVNKPKAPNYSKAESWAVLPGRYPDSLQSFVGSAIPPEGVDVFYVYPTLFTDPRKKHGMRMSILKSLEKLS